MFQVGGRACWLCFCSKTASLRGAHVVERAWTPRGDIVIAAMVASLDELGGNVFFFEFLLLGELVQGTGVPSPSFRRAGSFSRPCSTTTALSAVEGKAALQWVILASSHGWSSARRQEQGGAARIRHGCKRGLEVRSSRGMMSTVSTHSTRGAKMGERGASGAPRKQRHR